MSGMARGGFIPGSGTVTVSRSGDCPDGHPLYSIGGGADEHVVTQAAMRDGTAHAILQCQRRLEERQAMECNG